MVNNYNLEWELLKKSKVTNRAPSSITSDIKNHIDDLENCQCGCKIVNTYYNKETKK